MAKNFRELRAGMSPGALAASATEHLRLLEEMSLHQLRKARELTRISHTRSVGPEKNRMAGAFAEFSSFEENILNGLAKRRGPADPFGGLPGDSSAARAHCSEPGVPSGIT